ncbi:uncharacterized protein Dvir_GJ25761 [Drosophila virilis]|uniref:F-box domain-containing protein n=1 Tax=Drosophila virilis TaxID=7244 RepID=A0A0Q9WLW5_DROVI|nr:uncharacterized protein LOC26530531 [Drosophila virilis]KRF85110.1 uncharacterized protein Dvir_GJ25761 [Drosophila virilis]
MESYECTVTILDLNDYCLESIFDYLEGKDLINFAETCSRARQVFKHWSSFRYVNFFVVEEISTYELKLLSIVAENVRKLCIYVDDLNVFLSRNYGKNKNYFFNKFCMLINDMTSLQSFGLWQYTKKVSTRSIFLALQKKNLKNLQICAPKCESAALRSFTELEMLSLNVQLSSKDLLKSCQSMRQLRALHLTDRVGNSSLKDIIYHCSNLQELSFYIKTKKNNINCTTLKGTGATDIFGALADSAKCLKSLIVHGIICDLNQAKQLAGISTLRILKCSFANADCVLALRNLTLLEELRISFKCDVNISSIYLDLIRECAHLYLLSIVDFNVQPDFAIKAAEVRKEFVNRRPLVLQIYGHRNSTIEPTAADIDKRLVIYRCMTLQELLKL